MNKIYYQCGRGTYYNEYKLLRIFFKIPKMCQSHGIYFVLNSGVNLLQASTWSMWPTEFWTSKCHDMGCSQMAVTQPILLPCNCHYCGLLRKILKFTLHVNVQKALAQWFTQQPNSSQARLCICGTPVNACGYCSWLLQCLHLSPSGFSTSQQQQ